jgi:RNA polymerase sigma factor, sigma-70 family
MQHTELTQYTQFLLSAAIKMSGNIAEAQDITQDALLDALVYLSKGNEINDAKGFLLTVMRRKYYAMLRRKYKMATVNIDDHADFLADDTDYFEKITQTDEAESVRRTVAHLAKIHREVIVRHYMNGESVEKIAKELNIPVGTVKSRLSSGREHMKKEFITMENYGKQSYAPIKLEVSNSGGTGMNGEPWSLVYGNLIAQNLLYLAYREPVTETELSRTIGIPSAYVEPIVEKLVNGELMKRVGNKVYTDFILYTPEDEEKYVAAQKQLVADNSELFMRAVRDGIDKVRGMKFYETLTQTQRDSLEMFFAFHCFDHGIFNAVTKILGSPQVFPERPNGGEWIAFGHVYPSDGFSLDDHPDILSHKYCGHRFSRLYDFLGAKQVEFITYDAVGFGGEVYPREMSDDGVLKLLWAIESGVDFNSTGIDASLAERIPFLNECRILRTEDGKPAVDVPVISLDEWRGEFSEALSTACRSYSDDIEELLRGYLRDKKHEIPAHLTSVPVQKQYMFPFYAIAMISIRRAMAEGILTDGRYDEGNACPYPMVMVVDR